MHILYLGLSSNISGVAEAFHGNGHTVHFVKPGEKTSRGVIAGNILATKPIDLIVIAETNDDNAPAPQTGYLLETLAQQGVSLPILGLASHFSEKTYADFLAVGHAFMPLRPFNGKGFRIASELLLRQAASLMGLHVANSQPSGAMEARASGVSKTDSKRSFYDFTVDLSSETKTIFFRGHELEIGRVNSLLFAALMVHHVPGALVSREAIHKTISEWGATTKATDIAQRIRAMQRSLTQALALLECQIDFPLLETGPKTGWMLIGDNFLRLAKLPVQGLNRLSSDVEILEYWEASDVDAFRYRGLSIHKVTKEITFRGHALVLSDTERDLLTQLSRAKGETVAGKRLHQKIWGINSSVQLDVVRNHLGHINMKLPVQMQAIGLPHDCLRIETEYRPPHRRAHYRLSINAQE